MTGSGRTAVGGMVLSVLVGWGAASASTQRTTLPASIVRVDTRSNEAVLAVEGDLLPRVGDPVSFWQVTGGVRAALPGTWVVSGVEGDEIHVRATSRPEQTGELGRTFNVEIESANPRPRPVTSGDGAEALRREGDRHFHGNGVPRDYAAALHWYTRAAEAGSSGAMVRLGYLYSQGLGAPRDDAQAIAWLRKAAEAGNPDGQRNLGHMYQKGYGTRQDYGEAMRLYRLAAAQDQPDAFNDLGTMYVEGLGVAQDYGEAMRLFRRAAELHLPLAFFNMAVMYENGLGVPVDERRAIELYREAARRGHEISQERLRARGLGWQQEG